MRGCGGGRKGVRATEEGWCIIYPRAGRAERAKYVIFDWPWFKRVYIYIYMYRLWYIYTCKHTAHTHTLYVYIKCACVRVYIVASAAAAAGIRWSGTSSYSQTMNNKTLIQTAIFAIKHSCRHCRRIKLYNIIIYKSRSRGVTSCTHRNIPTRSYVLTRARCIRVSSYIYVCYTVVERIIIHLYHDSCQCASDCARSNLGANTFRNLPSYCSHLEYKRDHYFQFLFHTGPREDLN